MNGTRDKEHVATIDDSWLDPREAARLLEQTRRDAQRHFGMQPPLLMAASGVVILLGYGALWLSTRGQHPYSGPSAGAIILVYVMVAVAVAVSVKIYRRATAGVSGPSVRQQGAEGAAILVSYIGSPVIQGAMKHYGASHAIVYGVIPAAGPLIIVGTTVLGIAASKSDWPQLGAALTVVTAGIVAAFVGPSGAWLAAGIGLSVAVVGYAAVTAWQRCAASRV